MSIWVLVVCAAVWFGFGFLSYGFTKGLIKDDLIRYRKADPYAIYSWKNEKECLVAFVLGPIILLWLLRLSIIYETKLVFCFRMPKELCQKRS